MPVKDVLVGKTSPREDTSSEKKKLYAKGKSSGTFSLKDIIHFMGITSTAGSADTHAVLHAFVDAVKHSLSQGYIVRVVDMDNFQLSVSSIPEDAPSILRLKNVRKARMIFQADKDHRK